MSKLDPNNPITVVIPRDQWARGPEQSSDRLYLNNPDGHCCIGWVGLALGTRFEGKINGEVKDTLGKAFDQAAVDINDATFLAEIHREDALQVCGLRHGVKFEFEDSLEGKV